MADVKVFDKKGKKLAALSVPEKDLAGEINPALLKQVSIAYMNNSKKRTASTKTRKEVAGSGIKPWRQKGTGRARSGSRQSPIWRGGGVVFGPHPRDTYKEIPRKMRQMALRQSLTGKIQDDQVILFQDFGLDKPCTREVNAFLEKTGVLGARVLLLTADENLYKSARNIARVEVKNPAQANALDVLTCGYLVACQADFEAILDRVKS